MVVPNYISNDLEQLYFFPTNIGIEIILGPGCLTSVCTLTLKGHLVMQIIYNGFINIQWTTFQLRFFYFFLFINCENCSSCFIKPKKLAFLF